MFGCISTGKSQLINALFNQPGKCKVGAGETTKAIAKIGEINNMTLWDLPGNSVHFNFLVFEQLSFLKSLSKVCVIVEGSLNDPFYHDLLRVCKQLKQKIVVIRSKIDLVLEVERADLRAQINRELVVAYGEPAPLFFVSAKEFLAGNHNYADWQQMVRGLTA